MNIYVNSKLQVVPKEIDTLGKLIDFLRIPRGGTGIGLNNKLILSKVWDSTPLHPDDRVMIIAAAYGG